MLCNTLAQIRQIRLDLWSNGYRPVPITAGEKFPKQFRWPDLARCDPPWAVLNISMDMPGTGIATAGLQAVDIDINDPLLAARMDAYTVRLCGDAPLRYRPGSSRLARLYRAADGEPGKRYVARKATGERVEILGRGQQLFSVGLHPSGTWLHWQNPPTVWPLSLLPAITADQVDELLDYAGALINADYRPTRQPIPRVVGGDLATPRIFPTSTGPWPIGDVRAALAVILPTTDRDEWFKIACAVHHATGGSAEGYEVWRQWSAPAANYQASTCQSLWDSLNGAQYYSAGTLAWAARQFEPHWTLPSRHGFTPYRPRSCGR